MAKPLPARRALALREGRPPAWDRLIAMAFFVALLHGLVILGITFNAGASDVAGAPGLKVLLVSDELPEAKANATAAYLAQRTQLGSGNTSESVDPNGPPTNRPALSHPGTPQGDSMRLQGDMGGQKSERLLTTTAWVTNVRYLADAGTAGSERDQPLLVEEPPTARPGPDEPGPVQLTGPKHDELLVTPDTREAVIAPYISSWRDKVERIGTINFPYAAARQSAATANPVLELALSADGKVQSVTIARSSGDPALDQAALSTVKLASPFDPFPPEMTAKYRNRTLRFRYEWQFSGGGRRHGTVTTSP